MATTLMLFNRSQENGKPETLYFRTSTGCQPMEGSIPATPGIAPVLVQVSVDKVAIVFDNKPILQADAPSADAK